MKFTLSMLKDYVETDRTPQEIGDLFTMTGFELEDIEIVEGEPVFDINIMANRGDGASVFGLARELLAKDPDAKPTNLYQEAQNYFPPNDPGARDVWAKTSVEIQTPDCTRYACRVFENTTNGESPEWLQKRLRQIGARPISLLVDLTNYVMFEIGQPLHAFDLDLLEGQRIIVREATPGETLTTIDGTRHNLQPRQMMICDAKKPVAVAGVMGGSETEVSAATTRCLLESAHFDNTSVRRTRKQLGLQTEASYRFERHVDPAGVVAALNRFAQLYQDCGGPAPVPGVADAYPTQPSPREVTVRISRANQLLGMEVTATQASNYLDKLGFQIIHEQGDAITVQTPTWRADIAREEDLVEEIGRVHGYDKIPEALPIGSTPVGGTHGFYHMVETIQQTLLRAGYDQTISHTLRDTHPLDAPTDRILVRNPHAPEMAHLRNSLLPALAEAAVRNGAANLHIFETGRVHQMVEPNQRVEITHLAILSTSDRTRPHWQKPPADQASFYTLKGLLEELARATQLPLTLKRNTTDPRLHPTRQAKIILAGQDCGLFGQIHPLAAEAAALPPETVLAEINLSALENAQPQPLKLKPVSRHPATRRDIALLVKKEVPYAELAAAIETAAEQNLPGALEKHWLFDVYEGQGVPDGQHSLAIALQLRKPNGTFTDEEANQLRDAVVKALEPLGAKLR